MRAILLCLCFLAPVSAWAKPAAVTLFPAGARVTERLDLPLTADGGLARAVFSLPIQADPATLAVRPPKGLTLADLSWRQTEATDHAARVAELRETLEALSIERDGLAARRDTLTAQVGLWKAQADFEAASPEAIVQASRLMGEALGGLHVDLAANGRTIAVLARRIAELEAELARLTGRAEKAWEMTVLFQGAASRAAFEAEYTLGGCGWSPVYRLDARPDAGEVAFAFAAEARQSSGADWQDVELSLATVPPRRGLTPPPVRPWVIGPRPPAQARALKAMAPEMAREMAADAMVAEENMAGAPVMETRATFTVWRLGRRSLPAGEPRRLPVSEAAWKADYRHTVRPFVSPEAFLTAAVTLDAPQDLPSGQALFLVQGELIGKRRFSLAGREAELFFGADPQVTATHSLVDRKAGDAGFLGSKQEHRWAWNVELTNARQTPVDLTMEAALPASRHEDIAVEVTSQPAPAETLKDKGLYLWRFTLPPGGEQTLRHEVRVTAPGGMELDLGR